MPIKGEGMLIVCYWREVDNQTGISRISRIKSERGIACNILIILNIPVKCF
jgi:hypothetical protein